ncbi:RWD domain-containing protein 4 [Lamellibrachia satsuma]|nr:RWD domain-containing protein 4 [Lamellibrachia satsuma]
MSNEDAQLEELEVLQSIYDGDSAFKEISKQDFQYKVGEDQHHKSFVVQVTWGEGYPDELPDIHLDAFYNKHISSGVKSNIVNRLKDEASQLLGSAMTYTLFEYVKENADELTADQQDVTQASHSETAPVDVKSAGDEGRTGKPKKEQLSKQQKRKLYDRMGNMNTQELVRGWNWVDVVKHLSQRGKADEQS